MLAKKCGLIGEDVFDAHGIHFSDKELEILRSTGTTIAHCPSSNMRLGSGICRVQEMLEKDINVSLRLATINGAKTLGYEGHLGKIKPGYGADIAVFDVDKLPYAGAQSDPIAALIFCGTSHETRHTIVNGEFTVRSGVLQGFDEEVIKNKANEISRRMLEGK